MEENTPQSEQHHWHVSSWLGIKEEHGHEFKINVSRTFLDASLSLSTRMGIKNSQIMPRLIAKKAGIQVWGTHEVLLFGEYGLEQIKWPFSGGCWLELRQRSVSPKGADFYANNCDTSQQQSFLMAVWVWWAGNVADEIRRMEKERGLA